MLKHNVNVYRQQYLGVDLRLSLTDIVFHEQIMTEVFGRRQQVTRLRNIFEGLVAICMELRWTSRTDATDTRIVASAAAHVGCSRAKCCLRVETGRRVIRVQWGVATRTFKFGRSVYDRRVDDMRDDQKQRAHETGRTGVAGLETAGNSIRGVDCQWIINPRIIAT